VDGQTLYFSRLMFDRLFGDDVPARFESALSTPEAVSRLQVLTGRTRSVWNWPTSPATIGTVSASNVRLFRIDPFVRNSFKPVFVGAFREERGRTVLEGRFTMHWFAEAILSCSVAALFLISVTVTGFLIGASRTPGTLPLYPAFTLVLLVLLFWAALFGFVRFGRWLARDHVALISATIRDALKETTEAQRR